MIHDPPSPPKKQLTLFPLHPENSSSLQKFLHQNDTWSEPELVRTAMRSREREVGAEERWVCYSEVVEKKEARSTAADVWLKLDYEGILNAWSDKAPLFINGESPQTVPNLHDDPSLCSDSLPNVRNGMGSEGNNAWKVPEIGKEREASVLRYKEKRQSRLFSKRIRYQVRKLNAEKRPRIKGRFVKRS
ncbi:Protein CHLOROPLAST IMPORT APPARATUS 2, partial [Cucurbita argyrosperma subsp. argyrosperma]|uniref:Zinc finger protein CONSTANS-LIKE 7 isoform X1 n=1 Tax=Cucurbita moschata TaxID=3662 RepID=A0A6J1FGJ5_CUCMO